MEKELENKKNKNNEESVHKHKKEVKTDKNVNDNSKVDKEEEANDKEILDLEKTVKEQIEKIAELNDKYLRLLADRDNLIKRTQKEKQAISQYALESFMLDFLPVLDAWDKVESESSGTSEDLDSYKKGFDLIKQQILNVLSKHGLHSFSSKGEKFDPNKHQAMSKVESDEVEVETVMEEYLKGYMLNDKLLRAAFVVVQVPKNK